MSRYGHPFVRAERWSGCCGGVGCGHLEISQPARIFIETPFAPQNEPLPHGC